MPPPVKDRKDGAVGFGAESADSPGEEPDSSDSESSTRTIEHRPILEVLSKSQAEQLSGYAIDFFAGSSTAGGTKRRADEDDDDEMGHGNESKMPKRESNSAWSQGGHSDSFFQDPAQLPWYSTLEKDENEDEDEDEYSEETGSESESDSGSEPDAQQPGFDVPVPTPVFRHPAFPQTALDLFRQVMPEIDLPERPSPLFQFLVDHPVRQVPVLCRPFNDSKPQNVVSYLMQASGTPLTREDSCKRCKNGSGVYAGCVILGGKVGDDYTLGACANCWYNRQGSKCSKRNPEKPKGERPQRSALMGALGVTKTAVPSLSNRSFVTQTQPTTSKETPVPIPVPKHHHSTAPIPVPKPQGSSFTTSYTSGTTRTAGMGTTSIPDRDMPLAVKNHMHVKAWEVRYSCMSIDELAKAQKHLTEWQEDLMTRLVALNKVLLNKLKEKESGK